MRVVELRVEHGRAVVAGTPLAPEPVGRLWGLPADLVGALQEWARVADTTVGLTGAGVDGVAGVAGVDGVDGVAVSRRGRHLAARLSVVLRAPVDYCDPVSGHRIALRGITPASTPRRGEGGTTAAAGEPTPWGTGLALAVLVAGLVMVANLGLSLPMVAGLGPLGVVVDVAVIAGIAPALWLNRRVPVWRWASYGTFAGMVLVVPVLVVAAG